jgi:hypothetical protein
VCAQTLTLFAGSLAVQVITLVPGESIAGALLVRVYVKQFSIITTAPMMFADGYPQGVLVLFTVVFGGHITIGGCVSATVTLNEQVAVRPKASVAFHTFVLTPIGNTE